MTVVVLTCGVLLTIGAFLAVIRAEKAWMRALFDELTGEAVLGGQVHLVYEGTLVLLTAGANPGAVVDARRAVTTLLGR